MTAVTSIKETTGVQPTQTVTSSDNTVARSETGKAVMPNGRAVAPLAQNNDPVVSVAGKVLTDADIQDINTGYKKLKTIDVTGAIYNGSLVVSRKAIAVLLPNHPQLYVEGIFTNIVQELRSQISEPAQKAFDVMLARAKASFEKEFPQAVFDSAAVQSPTFVANHGVPLGGFAVSLCEASVQEIATIRQSPDVGEKILKFLKSTSLEEDIDALIKAIEPALFFENLRSVASLGQLLPILKKYEAPLEEYMQGLAKDPKCEWFQKDVTETITKLKMYQKYLWIISMASGIISGLLGWYPAAEITATVERYKRLFSGILKHHLMLEEVSSSPQVSSSSVDSKAEKKEADVKEVKAAEATVKKGSET
jgi:hypothetical protein